MESNCLLKEPEKDTQTIKYFYQQKIRNWTPRLSTNNIVFNVYNVANLSNIHVCKNANYIMANRPENSHQPKSLLTSQKYM